MIIARAGIEKGKKGTGSSGAQATLRSKEMKEIAREVAALAVLRGKQGGRLNVRQREDLRRVLAKAGEKLGWTVTAPSAEDGVAAANQTLKRLVRSGARSMKREVAEDLSAKKKEEARLEKVVEHIRRIADDPSTDYPIEVSYSRTARAAGQGFITKTETLTFENAGDAVQAAKTMENSLGRWAKLRDQMLEELKQRQKRVGEVTGNLSEFVESFQGLLREVIVTLP